MFKVFKRPRDAESDDEEKTDDPKEIPYKIHHRPQNDITDDIKDEKIESKTAELPKTNDNANNVDIFLWFDWDPKWEYQVGSHCQASFSYASPNDIIVAYNYKDMDKEWFLWLLDINELSPTQFLWNQVPTSYETYLYPKDILNDDILLRQISMTIKRILHKNKHSTITIKPYHGIYPSIHGAIDKIKSYVGNPQNKNIKTCMCTLKWTENWANKACLHRSLTSPDELSLFEKHNVFTNGLSESRGYICSNIGEILVAYDKLTKEIGHKHVVVKECYGDGGLEVFFYSSKDEIIKNFKWDNYFKICAVEENLSYHGQYEIEKTEFVGVQFYENEVVGCGVQMFIDNSVFDGSRVYTGPIAKKLKEITLMVMKKIGAQHVGGFDFAVQHYKNNHFEPKIYLIDMNTARYTEVTQTGVLQKKLGFAHENKFWIMKNLEVKEDASFTLMINSYNELLFNMKSKNGVYFHSFHPKNGSVVVSIFGNDEKHTFGLLNKLMSIGLFTPMEH